MDAAPESDAQQVLVPDGVATNPADRCAVTTDAATHDSRDGLRQRRRHRHHHRATTHVVRIEAPAPAAPPVAAAASGQLLQPMEWSPSTDHQLELLSVKANDAIFIHERAMQLYAACGGVLQVGGTLLAAVSSVITAVTQIAVSACDDQSSVYLVMGILGVVGAAMVALNSYANLGELCKAHETSKKQYTALVLKVASQKGLAPHMRAPLAPLYAEVVEGLLQLSLQEPTPPRLIIADYLRRAVAMGRSEEHMPEMCAVMKPLVVQDVGAVPPSAEPYPLPCALPPSFAPASVATAAAHSPPPPPPPQQQQQAVPMMLPQPRALFRAPAPASDVPSPPPTTLASNGGSPLRYLPRPAPQTTAQRRWSRVLGALWWRSGAPASAASGLLPLPAPPHNAFAQMSPPPPLIMHHRDSAV